MANHRNNLVPWGGGGTLGWIRFFFRVQFFSSLVLNLWEVSSIISVGLGEQSQRNLTRSVGQFTFFVS